MRIGRLIYTTALVTTSAVLLASPAHALGTAALNGSHVGATAAGFQQDCSSPFPVLANSDGWHFVLPSSSGDGFTSLTLTFSGGAVGPITSSSSAAPSTGPGWSGYFDNAGPDFKHAYVSTSPTGQTLQGGTATIIPVTAPDGTFNLSHTCPGTPVTPTPSPTSSPPGGPLGSATPTPVVTITPGPNDTFGIPTNGSTSVTPAPSGGAETGGGGSLGFNIVGVGALAMAGGMGVLLYLRRRRDDVA